MERSRNDILSLQSDTIKVMNYISELLTSPRVSDRDIDDYMCELENLCVKSRLTMESYRSEEMRRESIRTN